MEMVFNEWLALLALSALWTTGFSMFHRPALRGWRNLGWPASYVVGITMLFMQPWPAALATWAFAGLLSGVVYFGYEACSSPRQADADTAAAPSPVVILHALLLWPIMLPEAIEYWLADLGLLGARDDTGHD